MTETENAESVAKTIAIATLAIVLATGAAVFGGPTLGILVFGILVGAVYYIVPRDHLLTVLKAVVATSLLIAFAVAITAAVGGGSIAFVIVSAILVGLWYAARNYRIRIDRTDTVE